MLHPKNTHLHSILKKIKRIKVLFASLLDKRFPLQEFYERKRGVEITFEDAQFFAMRISKHPAVLEVYCFGSVVREGRSSNDMNLIVVVQEEVWKEFLRLLRNTAFRRPYIEEVRYGLTRTRISIAQEALFLKRERELNLPQGLSGRVDILFFPPNWQNRLNELQNILPHDDQDFMKNIAREAKRIA
ncbi:MAG: hypothetical protein EOM19_03090 [Candidatus Moranbacteria bacterium]|nr:hypothetical protein [Candidatus Moranbacteria bacterium]